MYNGIGLKTARGSGTNGFVQRNMSYIRPSRMLEFSKRMEPEIMEPKMKNQDKAILEHQVKREIEVFLMDLEDKMKEQGYVCCTHGLWDRYSQEEIDSRVAGERKMRLSQLDEKVSGLIEKRKKEEEGEGEELHDYRGEEGKRIWMESGKKRSPSREHRKRSRSHSRSRSRSHSHHHRHHHRH